MTDDPILGHYSRDLLDLDDLDAAMAWEEQPEELQRGRLDAGHPRPVWHVTDDGRATWALRKLAACDRELAEIEQRAAAERLRVAEYVEAAGRDARRFREFLGAELGRYGLDRREATGNATTTLPTGKISTRQGRTTLDLDDDAAQAIAVLAAIAETYPDVEAAIRRKDPEVAKDPLAKLLVDPYDDRGWFVYNPASGRVSTDLRAVILQGVEGDAEEEAIVDLDGAKADGPEIRVDPFAAVVEVDGVPDGVSRWVIPGVRRNPGRITATVTPSVG